MIEIIKNNKRPTLLFVLFSAVFVYIMQNGYSIFNNLPEERIKPNAYGTARHK